MKYVQCTASDPLLSTDKEGEKSEELRNVNEFFVTKKGAGKGKPQNRGFLYLQPLSADVSVFNGQKHAPGLGQSPGS